MADNNQNLGRQQGGQQGKQQGQQQRGNQQLPDENRKNVGLENEEDTDLDQNQEFGRGGQQSGQQSGRSGQQSDQNLGNKKGNI